MKRKIAFVLPSLHGGGAERAAVTLLNGLSRAGHELTLYLFSHEGAYFDQLGDHVRVVDGRSGRWSRLAALRHFLAGDRQDIVVSFLSHFTAYAAVRAARRGTKYVISQQTPLSAFLDDADYAWRRPARKAMFKAVARTVYPRTDLIAATSRGVSDDLVENYGVRRERIAVVHNPVDVDEVERLSAEPIDPALADSRVPTIVMAGRLAHAKNLPLLAASLERLTKLTPFRAWILGQGELEAEFRRMLSDASLADRVALMGFQRNPWKYMARADVFVLTSHYEGFGNVLIEAMASGLPVVATASYGTREIVQHEVTGLLVERHEPDAVAAALHRVLGDRDFHKRLSTAARARAREFSVSAVAGQFDAALERAMELP